MNEAPPSHNPAFVGYTKDPVELMRERQAETIMAVKSARKLLGMSYALSLLPELEPEGWAKHPKLAAVKVRWDDQSWWLDRYGRGDVVDLVQRVYDDPDRLAAAERIIEMVESLPEADRPICRPNPDPDPSIPPSGLPEIEDGSELSAEDVPEPPELVEGILHQGAKMILGGGSKSYKTWSLLDLGLSVAHGREWLGFRTSPGPVLYINLEIQRAFFRRRMEVVSAKKNITLKKGAFCVWNLRGYAADLSTLLPKILNHIGAKRYAMIILDPIYKVMGGRDENDAGQIAGLLNDLERLAVETEAAVVFGTHFSKGNQAGKSSIDRMSGSGVFARDPDTILALTQHEEEGAFTVEATLRNHPPIEPFVVRWKFPLMERDGGLNPSKLKQVSGRPKAHTADDLLKVLGDKELSFSAWKTAALKAGISETTFKALRKELVETGQICQSEETGAYRKTVKGEKGL